VVLLRVLRLADWEVVVDSGFFSGVECVAEFELMRLNHTEELGTRNAVYIPDFNRHQSTVYVETDPALQTSLLTPHT
jgi:hypothetical protein